jgi:hypothetical protein
MEDTYRTKHNEEVKNFETKIKRLFQITAETFPIFINYKSSIDEDSLEMLLKSAGKEFRRIENVNNNIRRMLSVPSSQSTEDAVRQLLFLQK